MSPGTDWPALLARLDARGVDVCARLRVDRTTVWRWRAGMRRPSGEHAVELVRMDSAPCCPLATPTAV